MSNVPLPEPDVESTQVDSVMRYHTVRSHSADQMHAHAAAVSAAARDCRTCVNFDFWPGRCRNAVFEKLRCTNGDRYVPLPPVRLWRKA